MDPLARHLAAGPSAFDAARRRGDVPADCSGATLSKLYFAGVDLSRLDLSNAEFDDCTVADASLRGANLAGAFLHGGRFERCDFRDATFDGASVEGVEFVDCDFTGAKGLDTVEADAAPGLGVTSVAPSTALPEEARFVPGRVAVNDALERELEASPDAADRWLVWGDWLLSEGDVRGELVGRFARRDDFDAFVTEHAEAIFPGCADEVRGGGEEPEVEPEWRHGVVVGVTLSAPNASRPVDLGELALRVLPLPVCRFLRRLSFGLVHEASRHGEQQNDYGPILSRLLDAGALARVTRLEVGLQTPPIDEDYGEPESLYPWGDLSGAWPRLQHLEHLLVKGGGGVLGALALPRLRSFSLTVERGAEGALEELPKARWPQLEDFELRGLFEAGDFGAVLAHLEAAPLRRLALLGLPDVASMLTQLVRSRLLRRLEVLDLHDGTLDPTGLEALRRHLPALRHLRRLDLTGCVEPHAEDAVDRLGDFIVLRPPAPPAAGEGVAPEAFNDWDQEEEGNPMVQLELPPAANADLDIPDEHGD